LNFIKGGCYIGLIPKLNVNSLRSFYWRQPNAKFHLNPFSSSGNETCWQADMTLLGSIFWTSSIVSYVFKPQRFKGWFFPRPTTEERTREETLWLKNVRTMDKVQKTDPSNTAPSPKVFRDEWRHDIPITF
jgi:hypothetical protein